jgi:phosphohistidine phosphatase
MRVILVRHGDADADIPDGLEDDARALTSRARLALPGHFAPLAARIGVPNAMFMSPLVRAVQTATLLAQALQFEGSLKTNRVLFPDGPVGAIEALLKERLGETIVLVGHQPSMGSTAAHFLGLGSFPRPVQPGTVIAIERPDDNLPAGKLLFYAAPGQPISEGPFEARPD